MRSSPRLSQCATPRGGVLLAALAVLACAGRRDLTPRMDAAALTYLSSAPPDSAFVSFGIARSPDGQLFARSDSTGEHERRVVVIRVAQRDSIPVITIREADPWSGISHRYAWTTDGTALLIRGSGAVTGRESRVLCLVYRVAEGDLLEPDACPP